MKLNIDDEQGVELLHFIFERELKPPFRKGEKDYHDRCQYYNRDGDQIGYLNPNEDFTIYYRPFESNIKYKVCSAFGFPHNTSYWWRRIEPHLKSWLENQINTRLRDIG